MENPWTQINDQNRILEIDRIEIENYNNRRSDNPICVDDFPEPFLGRKSASIYLLLGNPGCDPNSDIHIYSDEQKMDVLKSLSHNNENEVFPHYLLGTHFEDHPGYAWWHSVFQPLLKELKTDKTTLAKNFFCIELFGYHSQSGDEKIARALPSVKYTIHLIECAIKENKTIIIARGITKWINLIPALADYANCSYLASNRGISLSRSSISPTAYQVIKRTLQIK